MGRNSGVRARAEKRVGGDLRGWVTARSAEGWSIRRMAPHLGVTPAAVSSWVRKWGGRTVSRIVFPEEAGTP
jgi:transposase-like protein